MNGTVIVGKLAKKTTLEIDEKGQPFCRLLVTAQFGGETNIIPGMVFGDAVERAAKYQPGDPVTFVLNDFLRVPWTDKATGETRYGLIATATVVCL